MTKPTIFKIRQAPKAYKLDPEKLKGASQSILPYLLGFIYFHEDYEYFDVIKPYLDIPEKPKTLDDIQQEFDEKIDKLIETTKWNFAVSKERSEYHYDKKFSRIIQDFEYARKNGNFPLKLNLDYTTTGLSAGSYTETSFVIKQGNTHKGYYTLGNQRYFRYYMPDKPNAIVRFFMKTCLGFYWIDEKND